MALRISWRFALASAVNLLIFSFVASAQGEESSVATKRTSDFSVGARGEQFSYHEPGVSQIGPLYGLSGRARLKIGRGNEFRFDGEVLDGNTVYNGFLQNSTGTITTPWTQNNNFFVMEGAGSFLFSLTNSGTSNGFYAAAGLRYTAQDHQTIYDYRRQYSYIYYAPGLQLQFQTGSSSTLTFRAEYDILAGGSNKTYLSDSSSSYPDVTLSFTTGSAQKMMLEYDQVLTGGHGWGLELGYCYWNMAASNTATTTSSAGTAVWIEPANNTALTTVTVFYTF